MGAEFSIFLLGVQLGKDCHILLTVFPGMHELSYMEMSFLVDPDGNSMGCLLAYLMIQSISVSHRTFVSLVPLHILFFKLTYDGVGFQTSCLDQWSHW